MRRLAGLLLAALLSLPAAAADLENLAQRYLVLELAMGRIDPAHVDAYFGPPELEKAAQAAAWDAEAIIDRADAINTTLAELKLANDDPDTAMRIKGLQERLRALTTRAHMSMGTHYPFDEESRLLFGAVAPHHDSAFFQGVLDQIDDLLPGDGPLAERVNDFRAQFYIPADKLDAVFEASLAACRERTQARMTLPDNESFTIEYVTDKPWSGYNWYQGNAHSLIQLNQDLPTGIDRAVDLGCHEGYPGHHVYNALLERELVQGKGWVEYSLYPLFSPQSLIAEGSANYGIQMAFSREERIAFEKDVLFPLAGLDVGEADRYYELMDLMAELSYAGNSAARAYLDGEITREAAIAWLQQYALSSPERAAQRVDFFDTYRSYVINYNLGRDLVGQWVERDGADADERWARFTRLLSSPMSAADLE